MLETVEVFDDLHQPSAVEPRPGFDSRFSKGAAFTMPGGRDIDLHRTFVSGPFGLSVDLGGLFATSTPFVVGGRRLLGLGRTERFLHACYHAALGRGTPRPFAFPSPQGHVESLLQLESLPEPPGRGSGIAEP